MRKIIKFLPDECAADVWTCSTYLGKVKLSDNMHFAPVCAEEVAKMYTADLLRTLGLTPAVAVASSTYSTPNGTIDDDLEAPDDDLEAPDDDLEAPDDDLADPCDAEAWWAFFQQSCGM